MGTFVHISLRAGNHKLILLFGPDEGGSQAGGGAGLLRRIWLVDARAEGLVQLGCGSRQSGWSIRHGFGMSC